MTDNNLFLSKNKLLNADNTITLQWFSKRSRSPVFWKLNCCFSTRNGWSILALNMTFATLNPLG